MLKLPTLNIFALRHIFLDPPLYKLLRTGSRSKLVWKYYNKWLLSSPYKNITSFSFLGVSPIIVLTHLDKYVQNKERLNNRIQEFQQLSCPRIYSVVNYTRNENTFTKVTDANMIEILFNSCLVGDQVMQYLLKKTHSSCCCCSK